MTGPRMWLIGCLALSVVAVVLVAGAIVLLTQVPPVAQQLPPSATRLVVNVRTPLSNSSVPLNQLTTIEADAVGQTPIAALELWVDGTLVEAKNAPAGASLYQMSDFWTWAPGKEGKHLLFVRAVDAAQHIATSNVVHLLATPAANNLALIDYTPQNSQPVEVVATGVGVTPQEIVDLNPGLAPNGTINSGQTITVPVEPPPLPPSVPETSPSDPPSGPTDPLPGNSPSGIQHWIGKNFLDLVFQPVLPNAPALSGQVEGCSVKLYIADKAGNEGGFFIYRADAISQNFKRIATLDAHGGNLPFVYVDTNVVGPLAYYVAAFNTAGEAPSQYIQVEVAGGPACATYNAPGIQLQNGKLTTSEAVDKVYCYMSTNAGPWTRVPPSPNTFIYPANGAFDVSQYITLLVPPNGTVSIKLECWGWKGSALVYLGEASGTFNAQGQKTPIKLEGTKFRLAGDFAGMQLMDANGGITDTIAVPYLVEIQTGSQCAAYGTNPTQSGSTPAQLAECENALKNGEQVLHWNWFYNAGCWLGQECQYTVKDIDGFMIFRYRNTSPTAELVRTISDPDQRSAIVPGKYKPDQMTIVTDQYVVRAYKGLYMSADSNPVFVKGTGNVTISLTPEAFTWLGQYHKEALTGGLCPLDTTGDLPPITVPGGQGIAGYHNYYKDDICWKSVNTFYRTAAWFNLSQVPGQVVSAELSYRMTDGGYTPAKDVATNQKFSCANIVFRGTEDWRNKTYPDGTTIPGFPIKHLGDQLAARYFDAVQMKMMYAPIKVDVTVQVNKWLLQPATNYGFVLGRLDDTIQKANNYCYSIYDEFKLDLVVIPKEQ